MVKLQLQKTFATSALTLGVILVHYNKGHDCALLTFAGVASENSFDTARLHAAANLGASASVGEHLVRTSVASIHVTRHIAQRMRIRRRRQRVKIRYVGKCQCVGVDIMCPVTV